MKRYRRVFLALAILAVCSFGCTGLSKDARVKRDIAESTKRPSEASGDLSAEVTPGFPTRWKSLVSNTIKLVRVEGDHVYCETVPTAAQKSNGAFAVAELTKTGDKYMGKIRIGGTCFYLKPRGLFSLLEGEETKKKFCKFEDSIEITVLTPTRIEGSVMDYSWDSFNCRKCEFQEPGKMSSFVWVPE